ncbi:hypothetical protein OSTOST_08505 [Ostertagia ostertagi]
MEIPVDCDCRTIPLIQHPRLVVGDGAHAMWPAPFGKPKKVSATMLGLQNLSECDAGEDRQMQSICLSTTLLRIQRYLLDDNDGD